MHRTQDAKLPDSKKLGFASQGKLRHQELGFYLVFIFMTFSETLYLTGKACLMTSKERLLCSLSDSLVLK